MTATWPNRAADEARAFALEGGCSPEDFDAFLADTGDHPRSEREWERQMDEWAASRPPAPESDGPRYPDVEVQLTGEDSNAFFIIGRVQRALRKAKVSDAEITRFAEEATAGTYDDVIATAMRWVSVR